FEYAVRSISRACVRLLVYVFRSVFFFFFFNDTATTEIYTLSLHDALPISKTVGVLFTSSFSPLAWLALTVAAASGPAIQLLKERSEEHTSELQSLAYLVCRLLLEKKKKNKKTSTNSQYIPLNDTNTHTTRI